MLQSLIYILLILLFVPLLCKAVRLPAIVGYIVAGIAMGSNGFGLIEESATIAVLGKAGMIYLMFLSGIEIDLGDFRRSRMKSLWFGLLTFMIPCVLGLLTSRLLGYDWLPSVLLALMYGSHTLMTYPTVSRYGLQRQNIVSVVVGGTMLAIMLSLLCLGAVSSIHEGEGGWSAVLKLGIYLVVFLLLVVWLFPRLATWFIKRNNDSVAEFLLVMLLVSVAAWLADKAGLEAILGAFVAGVALNRRIPALSPLMNRISFVGNTFFIPIFLVGVGMMIDVRVLFSGWGILLIAGVMVATKLSGKYVAAVVSSKVMHWSRNECRLAFGLSSASAAGTLAVVTIGYNIGIFPIEILNAAVMLILFSCLVASFITDYAARHLALEEQFSEDKLLKPQKILVALSNPATDTALVDIALLTTSQQVSNKFAAVAICSDEEKQTEAQRLVSHAAQYAIAAEHEMQMITQVAANTANGILKVKQQEHFTCLVGGINLSAPDTLGDTVKQLLQSASEQIMLYRQVQPLNTVEQLRVAVPRYAEQESGFLQAFESIRNLAMQTSARVSFYANKQTIDILRGLCSREKRKLSASFHEMDDWEDSLMIAKEMQRNDMLILLLARPATVSYNALFESVAYLIGKFYQQYNVLLMYPEQTGVMSSDSLIQENCGTTERVPLLRRLFYRWLSYKRRNQKRL